MNYSKGDLPSGIVQRGPNSFRVSVMVGGQRMGGTKPTLAEAIELKQSLKYGVASVAKASAPSGPTPSSATTQAGQWTLKQAFTYALEKPMSDGGWAGCRWERDVRRNADQLMAYFGAETKCSSIRKAKDGDPEGAKTIDGFITLCREGAFSGPRKTKYGKQTKHKPRKNGNGTINRKLDTLHKALRLAHDFGGLKVMPAWPKRPREPRGKVRYYSSTEELTMLNLFRDLGEGEAEWMEARDQMIILIDVGVRWGELFAIDPAHFNQRRRELFVPGIEDSGQQNDDLDRVVPLTRRAFDILSKRTEDGKKPFKLNYDGLSYRFDVAREKMGLLKDKNFTIHTARHTFCSRLAQEGVDVAVIKELAGHKKIETTLRYMHLAPKNKRGAIDALERATAA